MFRSALQHFLCRHLSNDLLKTFQIHGVQIHCNCDCMVALWGYIYIYIYIHTRKNT
jgi:hypothetical protein